MSIMCFVFTVVNSTPSSIKEPTAHLHPTLSHPNPPPLHASSHYQQQQTGPAPSTPTPSDKETAISEGFATSEQGTVKTSAGGVATATATAAGVTAAAAPKLSRKDRAKRLLLSLATRHSQFHPPNSSGSSSGASSGGSRAPAEITSGAAGFAGATVEAGPGGGTSWAVSPLVRATDGATVRAGMVLASVAARGGQGVSEEAVDTLGIGVKEAIDTLVRCEHLLYFFCSFFCLLFIVVIL